MDKPLLWLRNRWLWLLPVLVSFLITAIWAEESFSYEGDRLVGPVRVENPVVKRLEITIQYPASLSREDRGSNAKQLIITTQTDAVPSVDSVLINLQAPVGVINFLDKDGNRITGLIKLPVARTNVPTSVRLEHANTSLASSLQEIPIGTSVIFSQVQDDFGTKIPELDLHIRLEPLWRQRLRNMARSGLGTVAPLSLVVILAGISARRFYVFKRIQPLALDMESYKAAQRWDKAAHKCREIMDIDPIYDDILKEYGEIRKQEQLQENRLAGLYEQAKIAYEHQEWADARRLLEEIAAERTDYEDAIKLLAGVNRLTELYDRGVKAELSGEIQEAIRCFGQVIAIVPEYEDAQARLYRLRVSLSRRIATEPHFMRMQLATPKIDPQYFASLVDLSTKDVSERLLELARDDNVIVRRNLAAVVTHLRSPVAERVLYQLLEDQDGEVRAVASSGLRQQEEINTLIEQLRDPDKWIEAGDKLMKHGREAVEPLILALAESYPTWERARRILQEMGDVARQGLIAASNHDDSLLRDRATSILKNEREKHSEES